jgi:hypothetical protein
VWRNIAKSVAVAIPRASLPVVIVLAAWWFSGRVDIPLLGTAGFLAFLWMLTRLNDGIRQVVSHAEEVERTRLRSAGESLQ